jgi:hypothetical protein
MRETRQYKVYPSDLKLREAFEGLLTHMKRCGYAENQQACDNVKYNVELKDSRSLETRDYTEFVEILGRFPVVANLIAHSHWDTGKSGDLGCIVLLRPSSLSITVESTDLNVLAGTHDVIRQLFSASNPTQDRSPQLNRWDLKKSIFLAHRFDQEGNLVAATLSRFLTLLGFDVLEGMGYEAREIPAKVAERISKQEIFICVATAGDHSWILSEASFAKGVGKYLVILCENGVSFNKGILGSDYEYISFPTNYIEKAYCDLLYALPR